MGIPIRARRKQPEALERAKARSPLKRMADHESKAPASSRTMECEEFLRLKPVVIRLSPDDSKIVLEAMDNPVDTKKAFAKAIKLRDRVVCENGQG